MNARQVIVMNRLAWLVLLIFLLATPFLMFGAFQAVQAKTNKIEDWLPVSYRETEELLWFRQHFTSDQFIVVSWEGCKLGGDPRRLDAISDDPRIEELANYLVASGARNAPDGMQGYFKSVTTGRRVLDQLTSGELGLRYESAVNRLKGALIGPDGKQTCLVITLTDHAILNLREAIGSDINGWLQFAHPEGALQLAMRQCGVDPDAAFLGGPPVDSVAIDEEGEKSLYRLATIAALLGLLLSWISLRSFRLTIIVFACGFLSAIASLAFVWPTGGTTDAFLLSMPSLVYVLSVSGAVHLIKYYREAVPEYGTKEAPLRAIIDGWKPTLLCSVTTAIGLLALCTSDLAPIRKFGIYSSAGVMIMLLMLFLFLPAALVIWPPKPLSQSSRRFLTNEFARKFLDRTLDQFWQSLGGWITKKYTLVTVLCCLIIALLGAGVSQVTTNVDIMKLFDEQARVRQDYLWLESNLARLIPIEIVVRFDSDMQRSDDETAETPWFNQARYTFLERAKTVRQIQTAIDLQFGLRGQDVIGRPMSAVTFMPPLPKAGRSFREQVKMRVFDARLKQSFPQFSEAGYLARDLDGAELWRISVRVAAFENVDYADFTGQLTAVVSPLVEKHLQHFMNRKVELQREKFAESDHIIQTTFEPPRSDEALSVLYTGVIPIIYKAQNALLQSLMQSAMWSFITITPLLIFVSRGIGRGLVAMIPNSLPVLVVFGGMGWLDIPVTIGSMMSASIALGVAVDDTIHYLVWFRDELKTNSDRRLASLVAYRMCATPTLQAALISGLGLAVFGFSNFTATSQFGLLMLTILIAGVIAELIMLPALLAGPLGRFFEPINKQNSAGKDNGNELRETVSNHSSRANVEVPRKVYTSQVLKNPTRIRKDEL